VQKRLEDAGMETHYLDPQGTQKKMSELQPLVTKMTTLFTGVIAKGE
jgi:hypothetical protein